MQEKNRAILFDLDGTLINSGVTFHKIVNELKSACGEKEISFEVVREFSSRGASLILKNSFPDRSEEEIYELKEKFLNFTDLLRTARKSSQYFSLLSSGQDWSGSTSILLMTC